MIDVRLLGLVKSPEEWQFPLDQAVSRYEITTPSRQAHFMAQCAHESALFTRLVEDLHYHANTLLRLWPKRFTPTEAVALAYNEKAIAERVYGGRLGNAIEGIGDGFKFRGRGLIQITGRANYRQCGKALGADLEARPELLELPDLAAMSAAWFFADKGCNELADANDVTGISRRINGGTHGLAERVALLEKAWRLLS